MSFENIQLPEFLLADLYKDCLVELDTVKVSAAEAVETFPGKPDPAVEIITASPLRFLGENKKNIAIIVDEEDAAYLKNDDLQFLTNVLKACQLNLGDIAIINLNNQQVQYNQLLAELKSKYVLLFNVEPAKIHLPFSIPDFQPYPYAGCTYMKAPGLQAINQATADGKLFKTNLWTNLKNIFEIR